jgi:hypothetical protein
MGRGFRFSGGEREETMSAQVADTRQRSVAHDGEIVRQVVEAIRSVRHGVVQVIIQDSRVVQIDRTEKRRLV